MFSCLKILKIYMRISLNNIWLTNDGTTDLQSWTDAHDVLLNGKQVVQDAQFLRAVAAQPLARGNAVNVLQFSVTRQHVSVANAAAYVLTAFGSLPSSGTVQIVCGASGESLIACTFSAVLQEMPRCTFHGARSDTTFVLRGGLITTSAPLAVNGVDGGAFGDVYAYPPGGSVDGGNLGDALTPAALSLDGGAFA
jgi:hypothetical protein